VSNLKKEEVKEKIPIKIRLARMIDFPIISLFVFIFEWYLLFYLVVILILPIMTIGTILTPDNVTGPLIVCGLLAFFCVELHWVFLVRTRSSFEYLDYMMYYMMHYIKKEKSKMLKDLSSRNSTIRKHLKLIRSLGNWKSDSLFDEQMKVSYLEEYFEERKQDQKATTESKPPTYNEMIEAIIIGFSSELTKIDSYSNPEPFRKYAESYSKAINDENKKVKNLIKFVIDQYKPLPDSIKITAHESSKIEAVRERIGQYQIYITAALGSIITAIMSTILHV